jgi:hypothetical protein
MDERNLDFIVEEDEPTEALRSEELEHRCREAGIEFDFTAAGRSVGYVLKTTSGPEEHFLRISPNKYAPFVQVPFERFRLLNEYVGIYSYDDNHIEVAASPVGPGLFSPLRRRIRTEEGRVEEWLELIFGNPEADEPNCRLGKGSEEFYLLVQSSCKYHLPMSRRALIRRPTLRIDGVPISRYDKMLEKLKSISDSCFFGIASEFDIAFELMGYSEREALDRRPRRRRLREDVQFPFPNNRYDSEPLSFYRYALSAIGMPLLQYLAFYQTLEFYFPRYSYIQARDIARKILKVPGFSVHSDPDVDRLVVAIKQHRASDASRNEREQLAATLEACVLPQPLVEWVSEVEERKGFFTKERESRHVTKCVLQLDKPEKFLSSLVNRIYDIRCKIVHAKEEWGDRDVILPYSEAAAQLSYDIELIRQIAEQVIGVSAIRMQL